MNIKPRTLYLVILCALFSIKKSVYADDIYTIIVKKDEKKASSRWSLSEWLDTRDRIRMMDLWLALHTPLPYEFYVGGSYQFNQTTGQSPYNAWDLSFAAFVTIFGIETKYESNLDQRWQGIFDLRVFGYHDQSTNITLQAGIRSRSNSQYSFRNPLAGVSVTLYLSRYFGIEGLYRHFFDPISDSTGFGQASDRLQGGAFLDFKFLRLYGNYFTESNFPSTQSGIIAGTKVYF